MNKVLKFAVDEMDEIQEEDYGDFATARIHAFADGWNRHDLYVSEETLKKTAHTIYDKPLVWAYDEYEDDIGGHFPSETPCRICT